MKAEVDKTLRGISETGGHTERVIQRPVCVCVCVCVCARLCVCVFVCARIIRIIGQLRHPADIQNDAIN